MWRHGDVLIAATDAIPQGARAQSRAVLAYGEVTGHSHRIEHPEKVQVWELNSSLFLEIFATTRVIHEEHSPITLPPGNYRIWQQREYTPEAIQFIRD